MMRMLFYRLGLLSDLNNFYSNGFMRSAVTVVVLLPLFTIRFCLMRMWKHRRRFQQTVSKDSRTNHFDSRVISEWKFEAELW